MPRAKKAVKKVEELDAVSEQQDEAVAPAKKAPAKKAPAKRKAPAKKAPAKKAATKKAAS